MKNVVVVLMSAALAACAAAPRKPESPPVAVVVPPPAAPPVPAAMPDRCAGGSPYAPVQEDLSKRGDYVAGGLFRPGEKDRVPGTAPDVECIPEPQVVALPRSKLGNRPVYKVLDREYRVLDDTRGFVDEGLASYYGEKFHGRRTSNWEVYDMYAFTAAHKTLPLPSFARVTNLDTGQSVVVRVNDRGPFHEGRVMDLSLAAAVKLGVYRKGTGRVRVEALQPGDTATGTQFAGTAPATAPASADHRFALAPGQGSADAFDAWMKQRNVRVATGRPGVPQAATPPVQTVVAAAPVLPARTVATTPSVPADLPATIAPVTVPPPAIVTEPLAPARPAATPLAAVSQPGSPVVLQVASFSTRDNAERALATLQRAGIAEARLFDALAGGQAIWRLRVGPLSVDAESRLLAELPALGFAGARRVYD